MTAVKPQHESQINVRNVIIYVSNYFIIRTFGEKGLPDGTIHIKAKGSAGKCLTRAIILTTPENTITYHNALCLSPQDFA